MEGQQQPSDVFLPPKKFRRRGDRQLHHQLQPSALEQPMVGRQLSHGAASSATTVLTSLAKPTPSAASYLRHSAIEQHPSVSDVMPVCPYCQLPLSVLFAGAGGATVPSPDVAIQHMSACRAATASVAPHLLSQQPQQHECPDGVRCASEDRRHYLQYSHMALARLRVYHPASPSISAAPATSIITQQLQHRDVQNLRHQAGVSLRGSSQLVRCSQQSALVSSATALTAVSVAAPRFTHSPHGSLYSTHSISVGSSHPSLASTSPLAPSPLTAMLAPCISSPSATAGVPSKLHGRCVSPASDLSPISRSRAHTMSPPRRVPGDCRPRSGSFTLRHRPSAQLRANVALQQQHQLLQRAGSVSRNGFSIAEIIEPAPSDRPPSVDLGGSQGGRDLDHSQALDLSVPRRRTHIQPDEGDSVTDSAAVDCGSRYSLDDNTSSNRQEMDHITTLTNTTVGSVADLAPVHIVRSGSLGSAIAQPPKKRRLVADLNPLPVVCESVVSQLPLAPQSRPRTDSQSSRRSVSDPRKCPNYKLIADTPFAVDAFSYGDLPGVKSYFLSHFHFDHYRGLGGGNSRHSVYCSQITGNLVVARLRLPNERVHRLPMNEPVMIHDIEVTLLDANHCPGAVMFLFKLADGRALLHVGDFRADPSMESYPDLWNTTIERLYLDTTYCDPMYDFPSQSDVLQQCVRIVTEALQKNAKTLVVCGSYTIGKERVFMSLAMALDCLFWASADKRDILQCLEDEQITRRLTTDQRLARVHVLPLTHITTKTLLSYLQIFRSQYTHLVAIKPTGWESDRAKPTVAGNLSIHGVPYSEHSSYSELRRFVQFVQPRDVIATNTHSSGPRSQHRLTALLNGWLQQPSAPVAAAE